MNKQELCNFVSGKTKMSKSQCLKVIDTTFDAISGALKKGHDVRLVGFGSWKKLRRKSRVGRNPQTGKSLNIPARNVAKFSMSENLYNILN
jgi:DNA-binding protein HU-beta